MLNKVEFLISSKDAIDEAVNIADRSLPLITLPSDVVEIAQFINFKMPHTQHIYPKTMIVI